MLVSGFFFFGDVRYHSGSDRHNAHRLRFLNLFFVFFLLLRLVIVAARKSAEDTLSTIRILLERGCKELINEPDSLGNTPLHALLVRYALEEARYGFQKWNKWDILHLVRFLLQNGAKASINQSGNSALACVFRHVRDWEVCYELLNMLIKEDGMHSRARFESHKLIFDHW